MMQNKCLKCNSETIYQDMNMWVCAECFHEWSAQEDDESVEQGAVVARDVNGNELQTGDSVTVIKDLKVKGSASGIKAGTKVKNITIIEGHDGHNISCKVEGVGAMYLKSELVKKV